LCAIESCDCDAGLVEGLLAGTDPDSARERARALGCDLVRPHRVVVVADGRQRTDREAFLGAARRAMRDTEVGSLLTARPEGVAVLCQADPGGAQFQATIMARLGSRGSCRVAVGAPCIEPAEFPRSYGPAQLALRTPPVAPNRSPLQDCSHREHRPHGYFTEDTGGLSSNRDRHGV
jgi:sugar diacid utilization regulator